eukprot:gene30047-36290_t
MADTSDTFITHVDTSKNSSNPFLKSKQIIEQVRSEHIKIQEVVDAFRSKVDRMVDKQRSEYVSAYEAHIQDVQKTLHNLREKAHEIANDQTKNERTEKLKGDLAKYKNEALQLEVDSDKIRLEMAKLMKKVYSVEKYRDWMLQRLRQAKKEYNSLVKEKGHLMQVQLQQSQQRAQESYDEGETDVRPAVGGGNVGWMMGGGSSRRGGEGGSVGGEGDSLIQSIASASQYSIDIVGNNKGKKSKGKGGVSGGSGVLVGRSKEEKFSRTMQQLGSVHRSPPKSFSGTGSVKLPPLNVNPWSSNADMGDRGRATDMEDYPQPPSSPIAPIMSDALGELVSLRSRKKELIAFVDDVVGNALSHRPFAKIQARSLADLLPLLEASLNAYYENEDANANGDDRRSRVANGGGLETGDEDISAPAPQAPPPQPPLLPYIFELATHPAVYEVILEVLRNSSSNLKSRPGTGGGGSRGGSRGASRGHVGHVGLGGVDNDNGDPLIHPGLRRANSFNSRDDDELYEGNHVLFIEEGAEDNVRGGERGNRNFGRGENAYALDDADYGYGQRGLGARGGRTTSELPSIKKSNMVAGAMGGGGDTWGGMSVGVRSLSLEQLDSFMPSFARDD